VSRDLQTELEKYELKAAHYEQAAQRAIKGSDRALYQGLARYCDDLATNFRQVIAKRTGAYRDALAPTTGNASERLILRRRCVRRPCLYRLRVE